MSNFSYFLPFLAYFLTQCSHVQLILDKKMLTTKMFVFWPNATVPFYVYPDHFDYEQSMAILSALADFNFKTCINFYPVLTAPKDGQHVLTFVNPNGIRRCKIKTVGHSNHFPHLVELGYDCIRSPLIEMMIMRALGLPFEHNRMSRTVYIDVLLQNVEPDAIELFTMDGVLPPVLRGLPYDINSVMHFEERDFSKNGHRTIIFKNPKMHQNRVGLTANDLRKIELVYGSECRTRDRQEKLEMCQAYPGLTRRKRDLKPNANRNLRVNRNITPPPSLLANSEEEKTQVEYNTTDAKTDDLHISLNALGIANETEYIKEQVFRVSALALENARQKYCNVTANLSNVVKPVLNPERKKGSPTDILGVIEVVADYAQSLVDHAVKNLTTFCENSKSIEEYQQLCELSDKSRCPESYRSRTASPKTRRRRDVSAMATEDEDDRDKTVIDADSAKSERGHKKKAGKYKTDHKKPRRFLKDIQYRENTPDSAASEELDEDSNVSLDKDGDPVVKEVDLKDTEIDTENKFKADEEERETEVEEDKEEFVKEAINDGLDSMLAGNNDEENDEKTASEEDGIDAEGKDTDVIDEVESQKETEEVDKEEGLDVAKSEEQSAKEVEEEEEIATVRPKKHKVREQAVDSSVDSNDEREEYRPKKKEKKEKEHSKKKKISHSNLPKTVKLNKLNKEFYKERRWPDGIVRYVIKKLPGYDLEDLRNRLAEVNNILLKKTCVKLVEVDSKEARGYDDYLVLDNSPDYVTGRVGGKQIFGCVELFKGDQHIQHTAMMVMAMLGFYFEVSRHDRDRHIRVHMRHIRPANHIYQKHRLAIALSIIRIKPINITTKDFLEQLKSKFGDKMVDDDDVTVCSDDFLMDDDDNSRDSQTILKDFDEKIIGHQIFLNDVDEIERTNNNSQTSFKETAKSNTENITKTNTVDLKIAEKDKNLSKNLTTQDLNEPKNINTDVISTNFDLNAKMELGEKYLKDSKVGDDNDIPKNVNVDTAATFYDSQKTQIYSVHGYSQNYTHYSQSQNNVTIPKQYLYKNRNNTNRTDAINVQTQENSEIVKENDGIHDKINNNCEIFNVNNAITEERITKIVPNNNTKENAHTNAFLTQENYDIFITNDNNKDSEINKELVDHQSQYSQNIDEYFNEMQNVHDDNTTEIVNMDVDDNGENNPKNTTSNSISENTARIDAKAKYYNVNLHHFGDFTEDFFINQSADVITEKNYENFEKNYTNPFQNKYLSESTAKNVHQNTDFTENTNTKSTEEFASNRTNLLRNKDLTEEYRITEEDCDSEEIISFKVLEEFNKVKLFVRRPNRRMSCDSYSSDSGYKSDSQRSNRSALQLSGTWLNQSGSCLFHYLLQCPLVASTRDITSEIAQVLGELIDKLHDDEKYPSFLEELLETIDGELGQVFEGANGEENEFLKKDERIQRILLLNKSIHIQAHTIEKITKILEKFHANITQIDSTYELQNIDEIENVSYIFHLLEILLKKYLKNKKHDSQSESTTQNYSKEDEKIFKKSTISDIWRKKWNPSQKKIEGSREKKCALKVCSDVLNKIVVDCVSSYSLVAYSALKCFNSMQN